MPATYTDSIDGLTTSVAEKAPVVVATNGAITLSGEQTVNGIACVEGDRVLVKDQDDSTTNGIYVCSDSAWSRALDFNGNRDVVKGTSVRVAGPSVSTGSLYIVTTENPIVIGTSAIVFVQKPEGTSDSTQFVSMEDLRVSTTDQDYVETLAFYASGTTGAAKLYRDGTGTPTGSGAAVIAAALAAGTFCNAAGHCYKLSKDQRIISTMFGGVHDGVEDDRAAILYMITACVNIGIGECWVAEGTSLVSSVITWPGSNVVLRGFGKLKSIIKIADSYANQSYLFDCLDVSGCSVSDIGFDGNLAGQGIVDLTDNKQIAFRLRGTSSDWTLTQNKFWDWGKDGIYIGSTGQDNITIDSDFENIRRAGVVIIAGSNIKVRGHHKAGFDQSNMVSNNAVMWEANAITDAVYSIDISISVEDMQGGVVLYNSNQAPQENISVHDCKFKNVTNRAAIVAYACGTNPVSINNNQGEGCGYTTSSGVQTDGGAISHENSVIVATGNTWNTCGGYLGTVAADGSSGRGSIYNDNIHINDVRRGVYWGYVFGAGTTGSLRSIQGNTMLAGGSGTANTYPAIEIKNTSSHNGSGDVIKHNQIQTSTTSGYSAGVVIDYDDTTSVVSDNPIVGNGVKYTFTNGTIARAGNKTSGTVTLSAAATTTINSSQVLTNSQIVLVPTNAAAATLMSGSRSLYVSARTAATSFAVTTADGTAAAGTETFAWFLN